MPWWRVVGQLLFLLLWQFSKKIVIIFSGSHLLLGITVTTVRSVVLDLVPVLACFEIDIQVVFCQICQVDMQAVAADILFLLSRTF